MFLTTTMISRVVIVLILLAISLLNCGITGMYVRYNAVTFAGTGVFGSGDVEGGPATSSKAGYPRSMCACPNGDVYFTDYGEVIRKVDTNGIITTAVGKYGGSGDVDGSVSVARVHSPIHLFCDSNNDIYFAQPMHSKIKKFANGQVTTIAGNGVQGSSYDGFTATNTPLLNPFSPVVHPITGEIYFSEYGTCKIKKITLDGTLTHVMGTGTCSGNSPDGTLASKAHLYYSQSIKFNSKGELVYEVTNAIRKVDANTGRIVTLAGFGGDSNSGEYKTDVLATNAFIKPESEMVINPNNDEIVFYDNRFKVVRRVDKFGIIHTIAGENNVNDVGANNMTFGVVGGLAFNNVTKSYLFTAMDLHKVYQLNAFCPPEYPYDPITETCVTTCNEAASNTSQACSLSGECTKEGVCVCAAGLRGQYCNITTCNGIDFDQTNSTCGGHGQCTGPNTCVCQSGYMGRFCEIPICYGLTTDTNACSERGTCVAADVCECKKAYGGEECQFKKCGTKLSNDSSVCSFRGTCEVYSDDFATCSCEDKWGGFNCEQITCFGNPQSESYTCNGLGRCVDFDVCNCTNNSFGEQCDKFYCSGKLNDDPLACSGNGYCERPEVCSCSYGFYGANCEKFDCFGIVNSNPSVCSGSGECGVSGHCYCSAPDTCSCKVGYFDEGCALYTCDNALYNESSVCTGRGNCSAFDTCQCVDGYGGKNCQFDTCFGILNTSTTTVCSGNGQCVSPNNCQCNPLYTGPNCDNFECFGINKSNISTVCSGHGQCKAHDTCVCLAGYEGLNCSIKSPSNCSGYLSNDPRACSGKGICNDNSVCECSPGYVGVNCGFSLLVTNGPIPSIFNPKFDFSISTTVVVKSPFQSITYLWKEDTGSINLSSMTNNQPTLLLKGNTILTEGVKLNFTITVNITESNSKFSILSQTFETRVNRNPVITDFKLIDDSTGLPSNSGTGFKTIFKLTAQANDPDVSDVNSVKYSLGYLSGNVKNDLPGVNGTFYFKLPYMQTGYVPCYLTVSDILLGETIQFFNVTVKDPTEKLADNEKIDLAISILTPNASIGDVSSSAYFLTTINSSQAGNTVELRRKIVEAVSSNVYSKDKNAGLEIVSIVTNDPQFISYTTQIQVLTLVNDNTLSSVQADKVLSIISNLLTVSNDSVSSNLMKKVISSVVESKAAVLSIGSQLTIVSKNINSTVVKNTIGSLLSTIDSSISGVGSLKIPSTALSQVLSNSGFNLSNPIVLSLNVASKSLYSHQNWNNTSPIFIFKILSGVDASKVLSVSGLSTPIEFEMSVESISANFTPQCVYVNEQTQSLSTDGIETIVLSSSIVKCRVNHLTDFTTVPVRKISQPVSSSSGGTIKPTTSTKASPVPSRVVIGSASVTGCWNMLVVLMITAVLSLIA